MRSRLAQYAEVELGKQGGSGRDGEEPRPDEALPGTVVATHVGELARGDWRFKDSGWDQAKYQDFVATLVPPEKLGPHHQRSKQAS
ncbi:hypothetical protein JTE90_006706 [Oedothorax gibbosus]|uniref:Uncharacterized protein n=1 Tax=Oedothorax gibbosus TaxID=931172 RepID=A0AAV6THP0_9ARAC|nr:hypothetical protein JTE90_006706 [Oedothorax gibbosus]